MVTFFSKTAVTKLINITREVIQSAIVSEVNEAKMYSVQTESTQDIASVNQCFIIIWYAYKGELVERLLFLVKTQGNSGENLLDLLNDSLARLRFSL